MTKQYMTRMGFADGVKPAYNPIAIPRTSLWEASNVTVDDIGILRTRPGSKLTISTTTGAYIKGVDSSFGTLLAVWGKGLYKKAKDSAAWTVIKANFLADDEVVLTPWSESGAEVVYLHDGAGLWKTDGTNCALVTPGMPGEGQAENLLKNVDDDNQNLDSGPAKGKIVLFRHGLASRMAVAYGNSVFLSEANDPSYFPSDQTFQLPDDGGKIVALAMAYGVLIIFRNNDVWAFGGSAVTDAGAWLRKQSSVGCAAAKSIAEVPGIGLVYLGFDNIYALQGVESIEDQYKSVPLGDDVVKYLKPHSDACGIYFRREYILSFPSSPEPERVFRYKPGKAAWYMDDGPRMERFILHEHDLYFTRLGGVFKYSGDYLTDNGAGVAFSASFAKERLSNGPAKVKKVFVYLQKTPTMQHIQATLIADGVKTVIKEMSLVSTGAEDFKIGISGIGEARLGRTSEIVVYECKMRAKGLFFQVAISGTVANENIGVLGYSLEYVPKEKMKGIKRGGY